MLKCKFKGEFLGIGMIFYRYEDIAYDYGEIKVVFKKYIGIKETRCGFWIIPDHMSGYVGKKTWEYLINKCKKWISKTSRKRYAYPTKKEALHNFIKRKERQKQYLSYYMDRCKTALRIAKSMEEIDIDFEKSPFNSKPDDSLSSFKPPQEKIELMGEDES